MQIITNFFHFNRNINYGFQYRFRSQSIAFYFYKEFICALIMLVIFQYINLRYLVLFSNNELLGNSQSTATTNSTSSSPLLTTDASQTVYL